MKKTCFPARLMANPVARNRPDTNCTATACAQLHHQRQRLPLDEATSRRGDSTPIELITLVLANVGSAGRKLLRSLFVSMDSARQDSGLFFSSNFSGLGYTDNASYSDYHSLQAQYRRNLVKGLQVIANYTWSHSTDDVSTTQETFFAGISLFPGGEPWSLDLRCAT